MAGPAPDDGLWIKILSLAGVVLTFVGGALAAAIGLRSKREEAFISALRQDNEDLRTELREVRSELESLRGEVGELQGYKEAHAHLNEIHKDTVTRLGMAHDEIISQQRIITEQSVQLRWLYRQSETQQLQILNLTGVPLLPTPLPSLVGTLTISEDGLITGSDTGANALYGGQLVGQAVLSLIPARFYAQHLAGFVKAMRDSEAPAHPAQAPMLRIDGSELLVALQVARAEGGGFRVTLRAVDEEPVTN